MTEDEFLDALEQRAMPALRRSFGRKSWISGDGFVLQPSLPSSHKTPVTGLAWTLGDGKCRHALEIWLTRKAHDAWRRGSFEKVLPAPSIDDEDWFAYDATENVMRIKLKARGADEANRTG